jgi:Planctomycete extracellular
MLRAQDLRAKVLRGTLSPPRRRRPDFETLESRQLLSPVDWISPTSGTWDVASNC